MNAVEQYQRKPLTVEAAKVTKSNGKEIAAWCGGSFETEVKASDPTDVATWVMVPTLFGVVAARVGDYVVRDEEGKFLTQTADAFEGSFDKYQPYPPVDEDAAVRQAIYEASKGLDFLLERQRTIEQAWGREVDPNDAAAVSQYVRDVVLCATDELHEVLAEVNWKPWKDNKGIKDIEKYREEMADVLHFILDLYLAGGLSGSNIIVDYLAKNYENLQRVNRAEYRAS